MSIGPGVHDSYGGESGQKGVCSIGESGVATVGFTTVAATLICKLLPDSTTPTSVGFGEIRAFLVATLTTGCPIGTHVIGLSTTDSRRDELTTCFLPGVKYFPGVPNSPRLGLVLPSTDSECGIPSPQLAAAAASDSIFRFKLRLALTDLLAAADFFLVAAGFVLEVEAAGDSARWCPLLP